MTVAVICGSRHKSLLPFDLSRLDHMRDVYDITRVVTGGATGVDADAHLWAKRSGLTTDEFPVRPSEWRELGKKAGPMRNRVMLQFAKDLDPDAMLIAFPGGKGTRNAIETAEKLGLRVSRMGECET